MIDDLGGDDLPDLPFDIVTRPGSNQSLVLEGLRDLASGEIVYSPDPPVRAVMLSSDEAEIARLSSETSSWLHSGFSTVIASFGGVRHTSSLFGPSGSGESLLDAILWDLFTTIDSLDDPVTVGLSVFDLYPDGILDLVDGSMLDGVNATPSGTVAARVPDTAACVSLVKASFAQSECWSSAGSRTAALAFPAIRLHLFTSGKHSTLDMFDLTTPLGRPMDCIEGLVETISVIAGGDEEAAVDALSPTGHRAGAIARAVIPSIMCSRSIIIAHLPSGGPDETLTAADFAHTARGLQLPIIQVEETVEEFEAASGRPMVALGDVLAKSGVSPGPAPHRPMLDSPGPSPLDRSLTPDPTTGESMARSPSRSPSPSPSPSPPANMPGSGYALSGGVGLTSVDPTPIPVHSSQVLPEAVARAIRHKELECQDRILAMEDRVATLELEIHDRDIAIRRLKSEERQRDPGSSKTITRLENEIRRLSGKSHVDVGDPRQTDMLKRKLRDTEIRLSNATRLLHSRAASDVDADLKSTTRSQAADTSRASLQAAVKSLDIELERVVSSVASTRSSRRAEATQPLPSREVGVVIRCLDRAHRIEPDLLGHARSQRHMRTLIRDLETLIRDEPTEMRGEVGEDPVLQALGSFRRRLDEILYQ